MDVTEHLRGWPTIPVVQHGDEAGTYIHTEQYSSSHAKWIVIGSESLDVILAVETDFNWPSGESKDGDFTFQDLFQ